MNKFISSIIRNYSRNIPDISFDNIEDITCDLKNSKSNQIVFCDLDFYYKDLFYNDYLSSNAGIVVTNDYCENLNNHIVLSRDKFYLVMEEILNMKYPFNSNLRIIGITGTDGKTSVAYMSNLISKQLGKNSLYIGTMGVYSGDSYLQSNLGFTTPPYIYFRKILNKYSDTDVLFLELSSHGLDQNRIYNTKIDYALWTNFSLDHLDYHKTKDNYFKSKLKIINLLKDKSIIISNEECNLESMILDVYSNIDIIKPKSLECRKCKKVPMKYSIGFLKKNLELSLEINEILWGNIDDVNIDNINVKGRFDLLEINERIIIIDFAHTSNALKNLLNLSRGLFPGKNLKLIFGCGGDRDTKKRSIMGSIAEEFADEVILTSDNPRFEEPLNIINDIKRGMQKSDKIFLSRKEAIEYCLSNMSSEDILIIAGKGSEEYQEVKGNKISYSDFNVVENFFKSL